MLEELKRILRPIRRFGSVCLQRDLYPKIDYGYDSVYLGSEYCGWYVCLSEIAKNDAIIYSFGVGKDISWDLDIVKNTRGDVYLFDPTPESVSWMESQDFPQQIYPNYFAIADFDGEVIFYPPINPEYISHTMVQSPDQIGKGVIVPAKSLKSIMAQFEHTTIDVLKMDIEGAEYKVLSDMLKTNIRPKQILIEFHHRFPQFTLGDTKNAIKSLRTAGYKLFAVAQNGEAYSWIYKP